MSNPHAHPHTMRKTHAKFQNNWYKTVRGVGLRRDTHCLYNQGEKWLSSQCRKSDKNWSNNYVQSKCTSSYHEENTCKVSKQWVQNCKRSCAHKIPMLNVDGWMDGRTNEQMNVRTDGNLHAYVFLLKQVRQKSVHRFSRSHLKLFSIFSSGSHFVQQSGTVWAIFVDSHCIFTLGPPGAGPSSNLGPSFVQNW